MCLWFIRGSWVRNQKLSLTNFQSLVSSPSILLLLLETILGSNIGCGAIGNNIGRAGCKQPQRSWGAVSVTKASDETVDGPSYKLWRELPPMLVERLFLESFEKNLSLSSFFVPSLAYQISSRPLFWTNSIWGLIWGWNSQRHQIDEKTRKLSLNLIS